MGKPKRSGRGFDASKPTRAHKKNVTSNPGYQTAKEQKAVGLINQGKLQEAEAIYKDLISNNTSNHTTYGNLGAIYLIQGDTEKATELLEKALKLSPKYTEAHNNMGLIKQREGNLESAVEAYTKAISINPGYAEAHINLGNVFQEQDLLPSAISSYKKAISLKPYHPDAYNNLGHALKEQGEITAAIASYQKALELKPNYAEAHHNMGLAHIAQGDVTAAISSYQEALKFRNNYPEAHINMGNAFQEKGDTKAAIASYQKALELKDNYQEAHINLGNAFQEQGHITAALASHQKALSLKPNNPDALWNIAMTMLLDYDYKNGWTNYEWRNKISRPCLPHAIPKCMKFSPDNFQLNNELLLISEQGLGDTLQFMRYAIALKQKGLSISICAQPKLHSLIQASGLDPSPLTPEQGNQVSHGQWIPLLSVPRHLEVTPDHPIITEPYIKPTEQLISKWKDILSEEQKPIIGINWQGNPGTEKTTLRGRSLPLETFLPITAQNNLALLSLQKGFGSEQLSDCSFQDCFVNCQPLINETWDFLETAAIIANCDLIITSDTSVAHLAGGMGKTTWLLLKKIPDWRWGLEGDTTFWYPSMRLFRQTENGNWNSVLQRVADTLQQQFPTVDSDQPSKKKQPKDKEDLHTSLTPPHTLPPINAPISLGELIDKITILQIKSQHLKGNALHNVQLELTALQTTLKALDLRVDPNLIQRLQDVNNDLWKIEDSIRDHERNKDFKQNFITLARSVYQQNDLRSAIKKEINITYGSALKEEKSYQDY